MLKLFRDCPFLDQLYQFVVIFCYFVSCRKVLRCLLAGMQEAVQQGEWEPINPTTWESTGILDSHAYDSIMETQDAQVGTVAADLVVAMYGAVKAFY